MKLTLLAAAATAAALSGCNLYKANGEQANGRGYAPAQFIVPMSAPTAPGEIDPGLPTTSLDRTHWPLTPITAWPAQPEHQPLYTLRPHFNDDLARNRGKFPTMSSSLDSVTTTGMNDQAFEGLAAPFYAAGDIILFIPRVICTGMWKTRDNGLEPYERAPGDRIHAAARAGLLPPPTSSVPPPTREPRR